MISGVHFRRILRSMGRPLTVTRPPLMTDDFQIIENEDYALKYKRMWR